MNNKLVTNTFLIGSIVYDAVFSPEECEKILHSKSVTDARQAKVQNKEGHFVIDKTYRDTKGRAIIRSAETDWIAERILGVVTDANKLYQFHIGYMDKMNILEYTPGGFYNWHIDITGEESFCTRKISVVVFLSKREDYEGGQLSFNIGNTKNPNKMHQNQGSIAIFPSYLAHRVETVSKGKRMTLVTWVHGNSFH